MIVALLATASGVLIYCTYSAWRLWSAVLDKESYEDDIRFLGQLFSKIRRSRHLLVEYYSKTTDRDYRILEWFVGPGMHTRLECCPSQVDLVARHVNDSRSVLEVGSGRGYCTNSLAASMPRVNFHGVDLVERQVQISRENAAENSSFFCVDVAVHRSDAQYDMIFGVESLCHVGNLSFVKTLLRPGGKLVIIDGFRRNGAKVATEMVEAGFRIMNRFLTKEEWIEEVIVLDLFYLIIT
jgi:2-polyprenyl-3-methyl-5-hydroxy-6-metoxy-1,4-benzoquinol methylase